MQQISAPKSTEKALEKLLDKMYISNVSKRLRELNQPNDIDRKRWIWELLQNAKDTITNNPNRNSIKARIIINGDRVEFQHDGDPFTADARLGLLYKYSEDKENAESTGRFGTGFLTTHCLSKIVSIESNMYGDEGRIVGFSVTMYRDGFTEQELIDGLDKMRKSEMYFDQPYEWTTYTYHVNTESGRRAISLGKENFKENIAQTLLFCKELASVELNDNGEITQIERVSDYPLTENLQKVQFRIMSGNDNPVIRTFIYCAMEEADEELSAKYKANRAIRLQLACEVDNNNIVSTNENTSLFCVFPLVGIESQLQLPVFVNCPDFEPDSERQSLILNGDSKDEEKGVITEVGINKKILSKIPKVFKIFIEYLSKEQYGNFFNLCNGLKSVKDHKNLDKDWYKENISSALREVLLNYSIVMPYTKSDTPTLRNLKDCIIVKESKKESEDALFSLLTSLYPDKLVSDNGQWAQMLWKDDTIKLWGTEDVCSNIESIGTLNSINVVDGNSFIWYNEFLGYIMKQDERFLKDYALLPNMIGYFMKKDTEGFKQGENVTSVVLDVLKVLGEDVRPLLLHESITAVSLDSKFNSTSYSAKANHLAKQIIGNSNSVKDSEKLMGLKPLLSVIVSESDKFEDEFVRKRQHVFDIVKELFGFHDWGKVVDNSFTKAAWEETDKWVIEYIISNIESKKSLLGLPVGLGAKWLNAVIVDLGIPLTTMNKKAIVPNQKGIFCHAQNLYIDEGVPDVLKNDVFGEIGLDYEDILLDKSIDLKRLGKTNSKNTTSFAEDLLQATIGYTCRNNEATYLSYGKYRKFSEENIRHVSQYLIQVIPVSENEGVQCTQIALRDASRYFMPEKCQGINETIEYIDGKLWQQINVFICKDIASCIEKKANVAAFTADASSSEEYLFEKLNVFYQYIESRHLTLSDKAIYPNQDGTFVSKDILFREGERIDKELKDIIALISDNNTNYYKILVDSRCKATIPKQLNPIDAYTYIDGKIKELYDSTAKWEVENFKKAARLLIDEWGETNRSVFDENHFPKVYHIKDSISMNVVWTKNERQQLQTLKNNLNAEDLANLVSHIGDFRDLSTRNKELEDENAMLRQIIENMKSEKVVEIFSEETNEASQIQMFASQLEAQRKLMEIQPSWNFPERYGECDEDGKPYNYSTVIVKDDNGRSIPIVLKSYKSRSGKFKINPEEWSWVVQNDARLFVFTTVNDELDIVEVPQSDLVMNQSNISITFSSENLDREKFSDRVSEFADTLHYFTGLHFNFERFHIAGSAKRVRDIYAKHYGSQRQTTDNDL